MLSGHNGDDLSVCWDVWVFSWKTGSLGAWVLKLSEGLRLENPLPYWLNYMTGKLVLFYMNFIYEPFHGAANGSLKHTLASLQRERTKRWRWGGHGSALLSSSLPCSTYHFHLAYLELNSSMPNWWPSEYQCFSVFGETL